MIEYWVDVIDLVLVVLFGVGDVDVCVVDIMDLFVDLVGIGDIDVEGVVDFQEVCIIGVGDYDGVDFVSVDVDVDFIGMMCVMVWVCDCFMGYVGMGFEFEYFGDFVVDVIGGGWVCCVGFF